MSVATDYLTEVYNVDKFQKTADACLRAAEGMRVFHPFDAIAFSGTSGAAMAYILSNMMSVPLICVRKPSESSHYQSSGYGVVEGFTAAKRYMIVDDFISSGATIRRIHGAVSDRVPGAVLVGIVLYATTTKEPFRLSYDKDINIPVLGCKVQS